MLVAGAAAGQTVTFDLAFEQFSTVERDGTRSVAGGAYTIYVPGHLPTDAGEVSSNVVS